MGVISVNYTILMLQFDAMEKVESMAIPVIKQLCRIWLFSSDEVAVNGWICDLAVTYRKAPIYDNGIVLDKLLVKNLLYYDIVEGLVDFYLRGMSRNPRYKELPQRSDYLKQVPEFKKRLQIFCTYYFESLVRASRNTVRQHRLISRIGKKRYERFINLITDNYSLIGTSVSSEDIINALETSKLLFDYES